jgi:DNA-binding LytR/AlgR family response regulator
MKSIIVEDEEMSRNLVGLFVSQTKGLELAGTFDAAEPAIEYLRRNPVDLIFLDVEMPGMSGYELLQSLQEMPKVVMITSKPDYAVEAFSYGVTDYLLKPFDYPRFLQAIDRVKSAQPEKAGIVTEGSAEELFVRSDSKIVKVPFDQILYIEALADYIILFTSDGARLIVHSTMKGIYEKLPSDRFVRVHRSYILSLDKVEAIENQMVSIQSKNIPIGASYKEAFMSRLNLL